MIDLKQQLRVHEGEKLFPYKCPAGYWTIGVGRNLEGKGLSVTECMKLGLASTQRNEVIAILKQRGINKLESEYLLDNDIKDFTVELNKRIDWFKLLPENIQKVLINMAFNMGVAGLLEFKKTLSFIKNKQYKQASAEMLNSAWSKQVGNRAIELSNIVAKQA